MTGQYAGYRTFDVTIPSGASSPSARIQVGANEVVAGIISPSDWIASNISLYETFDNGVTFPRVNSGAGVAEPYFDAQNASRAFFFQSGLSTVWLRDFKLASVNDQTAPKTITLLILER